MIGLKILYCLASIILFLYYLYLYQLKGYFFVRFTKLLLKNKLLLFNFIMFFISITINSIILKQNVIKPILYTNYLPKNIYYIFLIFNSFLFSIYLIIFLQKLIKNKKIKFKITSKILRNILIFSVLLFISIFNINFIFIIFFEFLLILFTDFCDIYKYIEFAYFYYKTKKYIKNNPQSIRIGITGSNGKTSIKNILYELIKDSYQTVITPKNFNTPKGIKYTVCKLCKNTTQCIIFEMGARRKNDILSLCKLTDVNMGILSNIASQHIETFKTIDNVFTTKCELPNYLKNQCCVFNFNDIYSLRAYKQKSGEKLLIGILDFYKTIKTKNIKLIKVIKKKTGIRKLKKIALSAKKTCLIKFDLFAQKIKIKNGFTSFVLRYKNNVYSAETILLGRHNISNILQAMAIALSLKIDIKTLLHKVANLKPTQHRLELIRAKINILDDSYNCSILSAKNSLEVLSQFPNTKICCTPGIIEGGKMQEELNIQLANMLKQNSDIQIIVGKTNRIAFQKVLNKKSASFVDTLDDAKKLFSIAKTGDTLLLLNDLPDDYN